MAGQTNLITSFVRRISKYFNSATFVWPRPKRAIPGTNHIDNPADFDSRTIYRGETIVDFDAGALYTQDGGEIIQPNTQPSIVEGLRVVTPSVVGAAGGGTLWVSVETGAGRILGKNYYHEPASGLASGDIQISPNPSPPPKARIDIIVQSAKELVKLADHNKWSKVYLPRPGCGAGELTWADVKPAIENILDNRFIVCTF
jgi:hypothetical protein